MKAICWHGKGDVRVDVGHVLSKGRNDLGSRRICGLSRQEGWMRKGRD